MDELLCVLCGKSLTSLETVTVKKKGLETLEKCSIKRDDGLQDKFGGIEELVVHVSCRKSYINNDMIKSYLKKKRVEQTQSPEFNFKLNCIFCNGDTQQNINRDTVRTIKMPQTRESIANYALQRRDSVSEIIMRRIENVDLVAVQAKYHRSCYDTFRFPTTSAEGSRKRGRPECDSTTRAMDEINTYIQNNNEECQFTMNDLKSAVSDVCPDERTIIKKIKEKYGDQVTISSSVGKPTLFCFGNASYKILHDARYAAKCTDAKEEKLRIIRTAASIILDDIRTTPYDTTQYPPPNEQDDAELNSDDDISDSEAFQTPHQSLQKTQSGTGQQGHNFGIKCSNCQSDIIGFRYTCVQCVDVDLCGACEARQAHATHYVLRIPGPRPRTEVDVVLSRVREAVAQAQAAGHVLMSTESQIQEPEIRIITQEIKQEVKEEDPLQAEAKQPKMSILEQALIDIPLVKEECIDPEDTSVAVVPNPVTVTGSQSVPVVEVPVVSPPPPPPPAKRRRAEPPEPRAPHSGPHRQPQSGQKPAVTSQSGFTVFTHTHARGTQAKHTQRTTTDPPKTSKANMKKS